MTKTSGVPPLERLRALQQLAHARRCAALAAAAALMRVEEGELDFTPTAMLMDVDLVRRREAYGSWGRCVIAAFRPGARCCPTLSTGRRARPPEHCHPAARPPAGGEDHSPIPPSP